jgi:hypothetical protein
MKRTEIITLFVLFASVFVLVGVLRYLNLYEGMDPVENDDDEPEGMGAGPSTPTDPPTPPSGGGPGPTSGGGPVPADASVTKFSAF